MLKQSVHSVELGLGTVEIVFVVVNPPLRRRNAELYGVLEQQVAKIHQVQECVILAIKLGEPVARHVMRVAMRKMPKLANQPLLSQ